MKKATIISCIAVVVIAIATFVAATYHSPYVVESYGRVERVEIVPPGFASSGRTILHCEQATVPMKGNYVIRIGDEVVRIRYWIGDDAFQTRDWVKP